jgi:hypothetical protein
MNSEANVKGVKVAIPRYNDVWMDNGDSDVINNEIDDSKIKREFVGDPIVDSGLMTIKLLTNRTV